MSTHLAPQSRKHETSTVAAHASTTAKSGMMLFRIVAPHHHRAVLGERVFWCERETRSTDGKISVRWSAFEGKILLQADCPTLNEAKKACRMRASGGHLPTSERPVLPAPATA